MGQRPSKSKKEQAAGASSAKDESRRLPLAPHNFHGIVEHETIAASVLEDQVMHGIAIYLAGKTKFWVHENTRCNCFMLFPRGLSIAWSEDPSYWMWQLLGETSDSEIEVASLLNVCWLDIEGKLELSHLTPDVNYNVVFEVMLVDRGSGEWPKNARPVNLRLKFPDAPVQERKEQMQKKPKYQWLDLKAGEIQARMGWTGEVKMSLFEYGGEWKRGLTVKGVKIVPKE